MAGCALGQLPPPRKPDAELREPEDHLADLADLVPRLPVCRKKDRAATTPAPASSQLSLALEKSPRSSIYTCFAPTAAAPASQGDLMELFTKDRCWTAPCSSSLLPLFLSPSALPLFRSSTLPLCVASFLSVWWLFPGMPGKAKQMPERLKKLVSQGRPDLADRSGGSRSSSPRNPRSPRSPRSPSSPRRPRRSSPVVSRHLRHFTGNGDSSNLMFAGSSFL